MDTNLEHNTVRDDFPLLTEHTRPAYLDSAATSQTPRCVLDAMDEYYRLYRANIHRGTYSLSVRATQAYESARKEVARFIGARQEECIFTAGATDASNMLVRLIEQVLPLSPGDEIVVSAMEHHASLLPLRALARRHGAVMRVIPLDGVRLDLRAARELIGERTKIVSVVAASNVLGTVNPIEEIASYAREFGAFMITDAAAAAGHVPLDAAALGVDALYFSAHKMCGPTGVGVLYLRQAWLDRMEPVRLGGGIVASVTDEEVRYVDGVHRFEAGTPPIAEAIGFAAAARYLSKYGLENVAAHSRGMLETLIASLDGIPGVTVYAAPPAENVGIVSFVISGVHPHDAAEIANRHGVCVRAGHHCAQPLMRALGIPASVRASIYLYTDTEDIMKLVRSVREARRIFGEV